MKQIDPLLMCAKMKEQYTEADLTTYSLWMHVATRSIYVVLGIQLCSTNGPREHTERSVAYYSLSHQKQCYREVSEFLDGRFVPVVCTSTYGGGS